jgi:uroporphyrinogen III methyltransferase / synthase
MPEALAGLTILVTRAAGQASHFRQQLESAGATVLEMPALAIGPPASWLPLDRALAHLEGYDWLILTSANGVEAVQQRLVQARPTLPPMWPKIAVVGQKTAASLRQFGLEPSFIPPNYVADALVEHFPQPLEGLKMLFPRVESGGRDVLVRQFLAAGAQVDEVAAYESCCPATIPGSVQQALTDRQLDIVTFASSKTVRNFVKLLTQTFGPDWSALAADLKWASIGPQTTETCQQLLGPVAIEAEEYTLEGLARAIAHWARHHP